MNKRLTYLHLFYLVWVLNTFYCTLLWGQSTREDSVVTIPAVTIEAHSLRKDHIGSTSQLWTEKKLNRASSYLVSDILSRQSGTYIKSYGLGAVATSSIRGASAGHTLVLWNGLPIQHPMLGQVDLSLLPLQAVESVQLTPGGNTAMWGSGAIGGMIQLNNKVDFSQPFTIHTVQQVGSFGFSQQGVGIQAGTSTFHTKTKISYSRAVNDFTYPVGIGLPDRQQTNSGLTQRYLGQDLYWQLNDSNQLSLHFWQQYTDRLIPPTNVQTRSVAQQKDDQTRLMMKYDNVGPNGFWRVKLGYFTESISYRDELRLIRSDTRFSTLITDIAKEWHWGSKFVFCLGNTYRYTQAVADAYPSPVPSEHSMALFASWKFHTPILQSKLSVRQQFVDGSFIPLVPAFGCTIVLHHNIQMKGKISRNFRLPTLNDRYWIPGGNQNLLPELGWCQEISILRMQDVSHGSWKISITGFNRLIDDFILWSAVDGQGLWSAQNLAKVWSRGLESRSQFTIATPSWQGNVQLGYDYIKSTNQVAISRPQIAKGEQLIYTPVHQGFGSISFTYGSYFLSYRHQYTGATQGINDPISAFHVGHLSLQYEWRATPWRGRVFLNIHNVWNQEYMVLDRRPMPGTHFRGGIRITFSQKRNTI